MTQRAGVAAQLSPVVTQISLTQPETEPHGHGNLSEYLGRVGPGATLLQVNDPASAGGVTRPAAHCRWDCHAGPGHRHGEYRVTQQLAHTPVWPDAQSRQANLNLA